MACLPGKTARDSLAGGELIAWRARAGSSSWTVPGWVIASAALSPVVMVGGWLAADALQPPSYSPVRSSVSGLSGLGGTDRWLMTSALILVGACYLVTAAGLPSVRWSARIVLMVAGLSSIGIAASPEPVRGSTPLHLAWTSLGAVAITIWPAFHRPPGTVAAADPEDSGRDRRDRRLPCPAGLARLRNPGRCRPGPGRAARVRRPGDVAPHRGPGPTAQRRATRTAR